MILTYKYLKRFQPKKSKTTFTPKKQINKQTKNCSRQFQAFMLIHAKNHENSGTPLRTLDLLLNLKNSFDPCLLSHVAFLLKIFLEPFDWEIPSCVTFTILNISFVYIQSISGLAKAISRDIQFFFPFIVKFSVGWTRNIVTLTQKSQFSCPTVVKSYSPPLAQRSQSKIFPKKITSINFKPWWCADFSYLKNLRLDPFFGPLWTQEPL